MASKFSKESPATRAAWERANAAAFSARVDELLRADPAYERARAAVQGTEQEAERALRQLEIARRRAEARAYDEMCAPKRFRAP